MITLSLSLSLSSLSPLCLSLSVFFLLSLLKTSINEHLALGLMFIFSQRSYEETRSLHNGSAKDKRMSSEEMGGVGGGGGGGGGHDGGRQKGREREEVGNLGIRDIALEMKGWYFWWES